MSKLISKMKTSEIVDYLRFEIDCLIYDYFDKLGLRGIFDVRMRDKEWADFINYCERQEGIWNLTEEYLEMWEKEKKNHPEFYKY